MHTLEHYLQTARLNLSSHWSYFQILPKLEILQVSVRKFQNTDLTKLVPPANLKWSTVFHMCFQGTNMWKTFVTH